MAEDDDDDQYLFSMALKEIDSGINCEFAKNGREAIGKLKKLAMLPDLIFLDLNMPVMNGFECLSKLKNDQRLSMLPVVIFTTSNNPGDVQATHQLGANVFLTKPSEFNELKTKIKRILELDFSQEGLGKGFFSQYSV